MTEMRVATLVALLSLTGCFDLSRLDRGAATDGAPPRDATVGAFDAATSACPTNGQTIGQIMNANVLAEASFADGLPVNWKTTGNFTTTGMVADGCIVPSSTVFCAGGVNETNYVNGPQIHAITPGDSYRLRIWLRGGVVTDLGTSIAQGNIYIEDSAGDYVAQQNYDDGSATWQEVYTATTTVSLDMATSFLSPFFTLTPSTCVVVNYVSVEQISP